MSDDRTDAELIAQARAGDDRAFGVLIARYERAVAATAVGMLGSGDDAEDVGQETFIRLHRSLGRFRGESSLKTYIVHIAMNLSINTLRRRKRSLLRFVSRDESTVDVAEPRATADDVLDAVEMRHIVRQAVSSLGEKHRAVVVLRLFHECSTRETAEILGVPEGTVLSRLSRAMRDLESRLEPYVRRGAALPETIR
ncbi:MAG TPA: RNA polymerase sigma factor [Gemmatimonadaceae bacterium]|nr:RNA polymerase sigma factor [Gemmatimonadaceae bacterium]